MYVIDTSALLDGWARHYPPDVFPSLWSLIEEIIKVGELLSPDEVLAELSQKDDAVYQWAKTNSSMFVPLDEDIQRETQEILAAEQCRQRTQHRRMMMLSLLEG